MVSHFFWPLRHAPVSDLRFVLPLLSFVLAVAVFGEVAGRFGLVRQLEVVLSLVFGLFTAAVAVLAAKVISRQFRKDSRA